MPLRDPRATSRRLLAGGLALALAAVASGALVELWRFGTSSATAASHAEQQVRRSFDRMTTVLTRGTVVIDVEACKGCDLCIDACPPRVLEMTVHEVNTRGYRYPRLVAGCTGCQACAQICPDFCFQVYKYDVPLEIQV